MPAPPAPIAALEMTALTATLPKPESEKSGEAIATEAAREPADRSSRRTPAGSTLRFVNHAEPAAENASPPPELLPAPAAGPAAPPVVGGEPITLEQLQGMALASHPAISEAAARVEALRGKYVQAGLPPNFIAGYAASEAGNNGTSGQQGVYLEQEFVTGGKLRLAQQVVCWEIQRAEQLLRAAERRVLTDVQLAYFDVLIAQRRLALAGELGKIGSEAVKSVEALVKAKQQSRVDLLQAQVEFESVQLLVANAQAGQAGAWRRLATLLGDPDMPMSAVAGDPSADLPRLVLDDLTARVMAEHPELAAAWADVQRARWQVDREVAQVVPNVDVQLLLQHDNSTTDDVVGIQATMPLPIINRNQGGIRQAEGEASAAGAAARRLELSLRRQLAATYQLYEIAEQRVKSYREQILPRTEETLRLTRLAYEAGELSFLELLTVQRTYSQTHLAALDALAELRSAGTQLEGLLLQGSLDRDAN